MVEFCSMLITLNTDTYPGLPDISFHVPDTWVEKPGAKFPTIATWGNLKYKHSVFVPVINFTIHETFDLYNQETDTSVILHEFAKPDNVDLLVSGITPGIGILSSLYFVSPEGFLIILNVAVASILEDPLTYLEAEQIYNSLHIATK